jgi:hypothetical protein
MIVASVKGFGPGPYEDCKVYENVAQCAGGSASTTGFDDGPPLVTGAQIGDSGTGLHLALGIVAALYQRNTTGRGQKVLAAMQDGVLNLCRVKLRDQQRLARTGVMEEYPQYPNGKFGGAVPRAGNASGGGQPGWILKCKGWETDPNAYIYFITQAPVWKDICEVLGKPEWLTDPRYATPKARLPHLMEIFGQIEEWTKTKTKFEAMDILNQHDIPCGPILSMQELADEPSLRKTGTVVEVDHPTRGKYLSVGNPTARRKSRVRRYWASTRTRSWPSSDSARTRSRRCAPKRSSEAPGRRCPGARDGVAAGEGGSRSGFGARQWGDALAVQIPDDAAVPRDGRLHRLRPFDPQRKTQLPRLLEHGFVVGDREQRRSDPRDKRRIGARRAEDGHAGRVGRFRIAHDFGKGRNVRQLRST